MRNFFNLDSPVMRFLSKMADLMILNILVLLCSLPIITVGASLSAMHYVLIKMVRNEETYIVKMFFKSFKDNFIQATVEWLIMLVVIVIFAADYLIFFKSNADISSAIVVGVMFVTIIFIMTGMYVFPLQARFVNTIRGTLKNAFLFMIINFPKSILMLLVYAIPVALLLISDFAVPFIIMFGVSAPSLAAVYLYRKVFAKFEPEEDGIVSDMEFSVNMEDQPETVETAEDGTTAAEDTSEETDAPADAEADTAAEDGDSVSDAE